MAMFRAKRVHCKREEDLASKAVSRDREVGWGAPLVSPSRLSCPCKIYRLLVIDVDNRDGGYFFEIEYEW